MGEWLAAEGLSLLQDWTLASRVFNLYLKTPEGVPAEELVTEACMPLA